MKQIRPSQSYISEDRASALVEKWSPVLDYNSTKVDPIEDDHTRLNTAILLENQEQWCLTEADNSAGTGGVFGTHQGTSQHFSSDKYATGDARLPKILIPMIRRTFPELITNEIVGVQPMSGPVGLAFALRYKYSNTNIAGDAIAAADNTGTGQGHLIKAASTDNTASTAKGGQAAGELGHNYNSTEFTGLWPIIW